MEQLDQNGLTEREFLAAYAKKDYPRPYLTADIVLFSENQDHVLLVKRKGHPFLGCWALPGGFAKPDETVAETAARELFEETGVETTAGMGLEAVGLFSTPGRDPRGWVVSEAYMGTIEKQKTMLQAGDDAAQAQWFKLLLDREKSICLESGTLRLRLDDLAFDHGEILVEALRRLINRRKEWIYV